MHGQHIAQTIIVLAFAATLWRLAKRLPLQNVFAAAGTILFLSTLLEILNQKTGAPFGRFLYTQHLGALLFQLVPWPMPLLWVVILLNTRAAAKFLYKRQTPNRGIQILLIGALFSALVFFCLEPIGDLFGWWIWKTESQFWPHAALKFCGVGVASFLMLAAVFPWMIDKKSLCSPNVR